MENALGQIPKKELWASILHMIKFYHYSILYLKKGLQGMCLNKMFTNDFLVKKIQFVFYDDTSIVLHFFSDFLSFLFYKDLSLGF